MQDYVLSENDFSKFAVQIKLTNMERQSVPVLLLTGYLGSGKTTLVNRILNNKRGIRFAVIVNDIGEVNIDADLIAKGGVVSRTSERMYMLHSQDGSCQTADRLSKPASVRLYCDRGEWNMRTGAYSAHYMFYTVYG